MDILNEVKNKLSSGDRLLFLSEFGSKLYGTDTAESDSDYKGIFLPSLDNFYSDTTVKAITVSTGQDNSKNSKDDVDIQLYSLQYFIHKLLMNGDTSALDLLFSFTNKKCVLFGYDNILKIYNNLDKILNIKNANAYMGYALGQAKKYGIKGSRLGILKDIKQWLEKHSVATTYELAERLKLSNIADKILKEFHHESYCFHKQEDCKGKLTDYLCVCGSMHQYNISLNEFYSRIEKAINTYGDRTKKAQEDGGIDYKALSHAVRVLLQCEELYQTGKITFPLKDQLVVLGVKQRMVKWEVIEEAILSLLDKVNELRSNCTLDYKYDKNFCTQLVKEFYNSNIKLEKF